MEDLRKYISKIISESIIEEDYESIQEIRELSSQVLLYLAKVNMDALQRQVNNGDGANYFMPVRLLEVYQENPKKFQKLSEFLTNSKVYVKISRFANDRAKGTYTHFKEPEYDREATRDITLYPYEGFYQKITDEFTKERQFEISYKDLYFTLWYAFSSTLEHELQHAYDDFRSNSKLFQARKTKEYLKKHTMASGKEAVYANQERNIQKYKEYLKLQHEIWARFTQAVSQTRFTSGDFAKTEDGVDYIHSTMKPLKDVLNDFRRNYDGWDVMPDSVKKKLYGRVSAYWHKELENIDKKNENSIKKEREALKRKELAEVRKLVRESINTGLYNYNKWKRNNVMLRGITDNGGTLDSGNGSGAQFGKGLYMAPLSNKALAKQYGEVYYVVGGKPKNPKVFRNINEAEIWLHQNIIFKDYKNVRDFNANTSIEEEMMKLGYDGLEIKGRETVNYSPENVKYYRNDNQLLQHYEHYVENDLNEELLEDYPASFDMEHFKTLKNFKDRVKYCNENLKRISSGSSRIAYKIDDNKVLKLAKNNRGINQNEVEIDRGKDHYYSVILAQVFDYDENGLWIEMELARKVIPREFFMITKFKIEDIGKYLINFQESTNGRKEKYFLQQPLLDRLRNDEFVERLRDFVAGTDTLAGDLGRLSSYGIVRRDGEDELVLIDFGLTEKEFHTMYRESIQEVYEADVAIENVLHKALGDYFLENRDEILDNVYSTLSSRTANWAVDQLIEEYPDLENYRQEFIDAAVKEGYFEMTPNKWERGELDEGRQENWNKEILQVAKQLGVELIKPIGEGNWGIAYEIPGNKVLKITEDEREIENARHLIGKSNPRLAEIYKIYSIKGNKNKKVIIMEKLLPLSKEYEKSIDIFDGYFSDFYNYEWSWAEMRDGYQKDFAEELSKVKFDGIPLVEIYKEIIEILNEAKKMGIDLVDIHGGNLGLKNGKLALFDIV